MNIYREEKTEAAIYQSDAKFPNKECYSKGCSVLKTRLHFWFSSAKRIRVADSERIQFRNHIYLKFVESVFTKDLDKCLEEGVEIDNCFRVTPVYTHITGDEIGEIEDQAIFVPQEKEETKTQEGNSICKSCKSDIDFIPKSYCPECGVEWEYSHAKGMLKQRSKDIELLEKYSLFLEKNGYLDVDWRTEEPFAIDEFLKPQNNKI